MSVMKFGKHKGQRIKDVPTDYLEWVCRTSMQQESYFVGIEAITAELQRRESGVKLEITEHAIYRAKKRLHKLYMEKRRPKEGICSWLLRVFQYVLKNGEMRKSYKDRKGVRFMQPRYEYFLADSVTGKEWKFVTQGNDIHQTLITVFAPGYTDTGEKKIYGTVS